MSDESAKPANTEHIPIPAGLANEVARVMFEAMKETAPAVVPETALPETFDTMGEGLQESFRHAARQSIAVTVGRMCNEGWMVRRPTPPSGGQR